MLIVRPEPRWSPAKIIVSNRAFPSSRQVSNRGLLLGQLIRPTP